MSEYSLLNLSVKELSFIENSIQSQINELCRLQRFESHKDVLDTHQKVLELIEVLRTIRYRKTIKR
jgi:hypothetical protein